MDGEISIDCLNGVLSFIDTEWIVYNSCGVNEALRTWWPGSSINHCFFSEKSRELLPAACSLFSELEIMTLKVVCESCL